MSASRAGRAVRTTLSALGISAVFAAGTVAGAVAHLDHPAARRLLVKMLDDALAPQFRGHLVIEKIDRIVLCRGLIQGVDLYVDDAEGHRVVTARGVRVALSPNKLVRSLVGKGPVEVAIAELAVDFADVVVREDASGAPSLAGAFVPRVPSPPEPEPTKPSKGLHLSIDALTLEHLWAHGRLSGQIVDADLSRLAATVDLDDTTLRAKLAPLAIKARALPIPAREALFTVDADVAAPMDEKGKLLVQSHVDARVDRFVVTAQAKLDGDHVTGHVEVPPFAKDALGAVAPGVELGAPAAARVDIDGTLADLGVKGLVTLRPGEGESSGRVELSGRVQPRATLGAHVSAKIEALSLRDVAPSAPVGRVDGALSAEVAMAGQAIAASYTLDTHPTTIADQPVPAVKVAGTFDGVTLAGTVDADEAGAPVHARYALAPEQSDPAVSGLDVEVTAEAKSLARVARLRGAGVSGRAKVDVSAHLSLGKTPTVRGSARVRASSIGAGGTSVGAAQITANVEGPLAAPIVHGVVGASSVKAGGLVLDQTTVRIDGPALAPRVGVTTVTEQGDTADAAFGLSLAGGVGVRGLSATLGRNGEHVRVRVGAVQVQGSTVRVDNVQIDGDAGTLTANASFGGGVLRAKLDAQRLDLGALSRAVGDTMPPLEGLVDLRLEAHFPGHGRPAKADVRLSAKGAKAPTFGVGPDGAGLDADVTASIDGRAVALRGKLALDQVGTVELHTQDARLGGTGDPLSPTSFTEATGALTTRLSVDTAQALELLPTFFRPVEAIAGVVTASTTIRRAVDHGRPDAEISVSTRGLAVRTKSAVADGTPGPRFQGVDLAVKALYEGAHDDVTLGVGAADRHGELVQIALRTKAPVDALIDGAPDLRRRVLETPFFLAVNTKERELRALPAVAGAVGDLDGTVALDAQISGHLRDPKAEAKLSVRGLSQTREGGRATRAREALDFVVTTSFADEQGKLEANLDLAGRTVMGTKVQGRLALAEWIDTLSSTTDADRANGGDASATSPRWSAGGDVHFFTMPLRPITRLAGAPVTGCLTGVVSVLNLHEDASANVDLRVDGLRVRGVAFQEARLTAQVDKGLANVDATLLQEDGDLRLHIEGGQTWGAAIVPSPDFERPARAELRASTFRLSPFQPLLDGSIAKLDGRLSADVRYRQPERDPKSGKLSGTVSLREGVVDPVLVGQEFRDISADLSLTEEGTVRLANAQLRGSEGRAVLEGTAQLRGLSLVDASGSLTIAKDEALPVTFQGVEYGSAWGEVKVTAKPGTKGATSGATLLAVDVSVPRMDIELPDTAAKSTQSLDAAPTIVIGTRVSDAAASGQTLVFTELPLGKPEAKPKDPPPPPSVDPTLTTGDPAIASSAARTTPEPHPKADGPTPLRIAVSLGPDIRIHKSNQIDLWLKGDLTATTSEESVAVDGLIQTDRGFVEVQGRRFSVENATVSFEPDRPPSDPTISATALYVAPDATRVFADFIGTVSTGSLRLRSEPVLTQPEILSLIVFGQRDGMAGTKGQSGTGANAAAGIGGGFVTQGLNKALSNVSPLEVTTRIDTTSSQNPRPEVGVAITKDVTAAVSYRIGLPTPGQAPDRSMLKVDYRFLPRWAVETTVGDRGTSIVDLTWKYRYLRARL